jgi:hypothetical protein
VIPELLNSEVIKFILKHENDDVNELLLKFKSIEGIPASLIADQINGRKKSKEKLPSLYSNTQIIYPPAVNLEQSSSEHAARFKLAFVRSLFGNEVPTQGADLTGGFGIDACFLSTAFNQYHFVEPNTTLISIARHNHQVLSAKNIAYENTTAEDFLQRADGKLDFIYIDPSRRDRNKKKVFSLGDCEPDLVRLQHEIFKKADYALVKTSPLLDLQSGIHDLDFVKKVIVLSLNNECKELLFFCEKNFKQEPIILAINLSEKRVQEYFEFSFSEEKQTESTFSQPMKFLYEPNASILKAGAFKLIASKFGLTKLHVNTHLYTSDNLVSDFPGRIFSISALVKPDAKSLKVFFPDGKANVTTRNYPLSAPELKKKTGLQDGGEKYLIGFTDIKQKSVVVAERIR